VLLRDNGGVILAILQARLSSTRLPGKVLEDVIGEPMIVRQVERLRRSELIDRLIVATSVDPSDDPLVAELGARGIEVRRGPLDDVVARFGSIIDEFAPDTVVRLTADCPLTDVEVVDRVIRSHVDRGDDYSSNTITPTFPDGLDVEVVSADAWTRLVALPLTSREREHVTLGLYSRPAEFTLNSVTQPDDHSALRWTVDVPADLDFVRAVYERLYHENPGFGQREILALISDQPELNRTEADLARNAGLASE
jgi:spore coat polysaccharide biosynthesis protein SpsF